MPGETGLSIAAGTFGVLALWIWIGWLILGGENFSAADWWVSLLVSLVAFSVPWLAVRLIAWVVDGFRRDRR